MRGLKRGAFWAVILSLPILTLGGLELLVRAVRRGERPRTVGDLRDRLRTSERREVSVVKTRNMMGLLQPSPDGDVVYELKPSHRWIFLGVTVATNSRGFRGHEYVVPKPADTYRIVGLGDSVLFGWGVEQDAIYTALLERDLSAQSGAAVEVMNLGVPGYNSIQEVALFKSKGLGLAPDAIVVNYCLNDYDAPFALPDGHGGLLERSELVRMVAERLGMSRDDANRRYYTEMQGLRKSFDALRELGRLARERRVPVVFFVYPEPVEAATRQQFEAFAHEQGFRYVDMWPPFEAYYQAHHLKRGLRALYVSQGDSHPNAEGHRLIADTLRPPLLELLREAEVTRAQRAAALTHKGSGD
jgi:lysophospholipase L1-like esterase